MPWRQVRRIRSVGWRDPYDLAIDLRQPVWTVEAPLSGRRIRIGSLYMGNTGFVPHELLARLEALRAQADTVEVKASRDPDAAG